MAQYGVPGYLLDKLKCSLCYEYLSYAPIYYHPESGSVCGRHPVFDAEKDGQPIHEKNYEYLASMMSFPCRYRPNGCTGSFTMTQMPEHEEYCEYKPYFCPILPLGDCAWQGSPEELHGHFATCHQILLLEIPEFELDIVNNYKENYLIPISNELFLLRIVYQNSDQKFRCCLHYIGKPNLANNYEYEIIFKTKDVDSSWSHSKLIAESDLYLLERRSECVVDLPTLKEILHEPTFIKVEIKITKVEATSSVDDNSDLEDFSNENEHIDINELKIVEEDKLLESIECQVCQEYMIPPIYQCVIGHNICGDCKPKLNNCPTCKDQIGSTRNFALEKLTEIMKYPCKNIDEGCVHRTNSLNIRNHESECEYKPNECTFHLLQNCKWTGNISSLLQHCKNEHPNNIQKGIYFQTTYNPDYERYEMFKIKSEFGLLFKIMYSYTKEHVACTVQCITRPKDNSKLMYEMQIIDLNSNGLELLSKKMCGFISDNKDDVKHCTFWNMDMIKPFISQADVKLKFKCVIFKI